MLGFSCLRAGILKRTLLPMFAVLYLCANPCKAETVFETFDNPPANWTVQNSIGGYFDWHFSGWLDAECMRDTESARFTRPLSTSFTSYSTAEFWFEYDIQVLSGDISNFLQIGLFDSGTANTTNSVGTLLSSGRVDPAFWLTDGSLSYSGGGVPASPFTWRVKGHFSSSSGLVVEVYDISDYGNQVLLGTFVKGTSASNVDVTGWDSFGLGNRDDADDTSISVGRMRFDNLYFSDSSPNQNPVAPSFHDDEFVYERFNSNPEEHGWQVTETDSSKFYWGAWNGWLNAQPKRDTATARFVCPVTPGFTNFSTAEFWFGYDVQVQAGESDNVIMRGLFSSSLDNTTDSMGSMASGNRQDATGWSTGGSIAYEPGQTLTPPYTVRVVGHFKEDHDGANDMTVDVYDLSNIDTNGQPALVGTVADSWSSNSFDVTSLDLFGVGNRDDGNASVTGESRYDNLYFSTTLPYSANASLPTFIASESGILDLTALAEMDSLTVITEVGNAPGSAQNLKVRHRAYQDGNTTNSAFLDETTASIAIPPGMTLSHDFSKTGISPELWSPDSPTQYLLRTEVLDADNSDAVLYTKDTTIGFRTFEISGKNFHLNGKPIYLRGYPHIDSGPLPESVREDPAYIDAHFSKLKNMNINWVRSIRDPESWYDAMDEKGIMVVGGSYGGGGSTDPDIWLSTFDNAWKEMYRLRNHPAITMWCLGNEWGLGTPAMSEAARKVYDRIKSLDPSRLAFHARSGSHWEAYWPGTDPKVSIGSDFLDYHIYSGWYGSDWTDWYGNKNDQNYPCTVTECVGAAGERDPENSGFTLKHTKFITTGLRRIGQAYDWGEASNEYCAFNTRGTCEEQRRGRGSSYSMCGSMPFNNLFEYPYYYNANDVSEVNKPVAQELTEAYEPLHISIRTRFPNQFAGASMPVDFFIMNDDVVNGYPNLPASTLSVQLLDSTDTPVWSASYAVSAVEYYSSWKSTQTISIPSNLTEKGTYHLAAQLEYNASEVASTKVPVFIAPATWVDIRHRAASNIAVYDSVSGDPTIAVLNSLSVPLTEITSFSSLSNYESLVIGYDSFDAAVAAAESDILSFINSGKRVLILQQMERVPRGNLNASSWLGASITVGLYNDSFVNMVRQEDPTLMDDLLPVNFRFWNSLQSSLPMLPYVSSSYFEVSDSDMSSAVAVLANSTGSLWHFPLIEIFPGNGTGGSCILSQLNLIEAQAMPDPLAQKFLANLVDYTMEARPHYKNVAINNKIVFGDFESEKGIFWSATQQGMTIGGSSPFYNPDGRDFRGKVSGLTYSEETLDAIEKCPMYIRAPFGVGDSSIIIDVENKDSSTLGYRLIFNGVVADPDWVEVSPGSRTQYEFTLPSVIPAGTDITLEIEAEEGTHAEIHRGLKFYSMQLADAPYIGWAQSAGLVDGVNNGYGDDPDVDTIDNLLEFALGGSPLINDASAFLPTVSVSSIGGTNYLNYVYRRRIQYAADGLSYFVGSTTDLTGGSPTNATEEAGSGAIDATYESVTNQVPVDTEAAQFMQLRVTID